MSLELALLSAVALSSLVFAVAIVIESRRSERVRHAFLRSLGAPITIMLHGWILRIVYLIGSLALAVLFTILPYVLRILSLSDAPA